MSKWPESWPPDWNGSWFGYWGKDQCINGEECYFVIDDYQNKEFNFYPDSNDLSRGGLGMRVYVRGLQWENELLADALLFRYHIENIGTYFHDKMVIGYKIGGNIGDVGTTGWDAGDDSGDYSKEEGFAYLYDYDNRGYGGYTPVGYFGCAILESPGNSFDGIDNDEDGSEGSGPLITEDMFEPEILNSDDAIVLIDYQTYERTVTSMPDDTVRVYYRDQEFKFWPGKEIEEIPFNMVDDNLNGVIDENIFCQIDDISYYLYLGCKYIDYFTGEGEDNLMIDERRDDGLDNDGDWNPATDDVGKDGIPETGDVGEGDGIPTSGEPNCDLYDIDESDFLGLTSFVLFLWEDIPHHQDELVWNALVPGNFDDRLENANIDLLYGSGYFPMPPGRNEIFTNAFVLGIDEEELFVNKENLENMYKNNYVPTGINENTEAADIPDDFRLSQNYPNPFNSSTSFEYSIPRRTKVEITIYNSLGQKVKTLVNQVQDRGKHQIKWHADNYASGIYFCRIKTDHFLQTKKMMLLK